MIKSLISLNMCLSVIALNVAHAHNNLPLQTITVSNLPLLAQNVYQLQTKLLDKKIITSCVEWGKPCDSTVKCCGSLICTDGICLELVNPR